MARNNSLSDYGALFEYPDKGDAIEREEEDHYDDDDDLASCRQERQVVGQDAAKQQQQRRRKKRSPGLFCCLAMQEANRIQTING